MDTIQQIKASFLTELALYEAYMPFIKGGGLFIRTPKNYQFGSVVLLLLQLLDEKEFHTVEVKVVWINPKGAQDNKIPGIGVQFLDEKSHYLRHKIEGYLSGMAVYS